jgi:Signal peptidase, peptidase S26
MEDDLRVSKKRVKMAEIFKLSKDKTLNSISLTLGALGIVCVLYVVISTLIKTHERSLYGNLDCVKATSKYVVGDDYMAGIFSKGAELSVLDNYYNCNTPKRDDFVLFRFSDQIAPVVRVVKGLPNDRYKVEPAPEEKGKWILKINDQVVKVNDAPIFMESNFDPPLKTYEISRHGVLMSDEYIVLSAKSPGLSDSTNLGLIHKSALIGRVRKN